MNSLDYTANLFVVERQQRMHDEARLARSIARQPLRSTIGRWLVTMGTALQDLPRPDADESVIANPALKPLAS